MNKLNNLFESLGTNLPEELTDTLVVSSTVRIERIVSHGQASPEEFWYDQQENEWVVVLRGKGCLRFADDDRTIVLEPGNFVNIPAGKRHRVEWTSADEPTVWLAVFY